jgi:hypothetical protein
MSRSIASYIGQLKAISEVERFPERQAVALLALDAIGPVMSALEKVRTEVAEVAVKTDDVYAKVRLASIVDLIEVIQDRCQHCGYVQCGCGAAL